MIIKKEKTKIENTRIQIIVNKKMYERFKNYYGDKYADKIREFIEKSPMKDMETKRIEQQKRLQYINKDTN